MSDDVPNTPTETPPTSGELLCQSLEAAGVKPVHSSMMMTWWFDNATKAITQYLVRSTHDAIVSCSGDAKVPAEAMSALTWKGVEQLVVNLNAWAVKEKEEWRRRTFGTGPTRAAQTAQTAQTGTPTPNSGPTEK